MEKKYVIITGSDGLVGSECVEYYCQQGFKVIGIDNNSRKKFFGNDASTLWNRNRILQKYKNFKHYNIDINNKNKTEKIFKDLGSKIKLIIHAAAQPSHDWAAKNPEIDFKVNALGTLNLLENFRNYSQNAVFIFTSTNKVYGDTPNNIDFIEKNLRYEVPEQSMYFNGIDENMSIDNSLHSLFGVSKLSADLMTQEYGKYFGLKTIVFRGGCLTGPNHSGTLMHGFLSYLVKCFVEGKEYKIFGYKGKQVRDNIHSYDLVNAFDFAFSNPKFGEVYNIGGSRISNCSILEAINILESISSKKLNYEILNKARTGDHKWYISNISKFKNDNPDWEITYSIEDTIFEIYKSQLGYLS